VAKEFEEECIVPSGALELTAQGDCRIWVGLGNVEGEGAEHGQIGRSVVLAIAGKVLVEGNVKRPVKAISMLQ
jgi:hypothetical protein